MKVISVIVFVSIVFNSYGQTILKDYKNDPIGLKETVLSNGMRVLLVENHDKPEIYGSIVVNVGSKDDPQDNTGMAHYLEHMLFKGTQEMGTTDYKREKVHLDSITTLYDVLKKETDPAKIKELHQKITEQSELANAYAIPNEYDKIMAEIGAVDVNAMTGIDHTSYFGTFPKNQLERWLEISVHRMEKPVFRLFQLELEAVYEESNMYAADPYSRLFEEFFKGIFDGSSYAEKILGRTEHLKKPSLSAMYDYFYTYYKANNMALVLVGDFDAETVLPMIEKKLLRLPHSSMIPTKKHQLNPLNGKVEKKISITPYKEIMYGYRTVGIKDVNEPKAELMVGLLSNQNNTGFIDQLYLNDKIMYGEAYTYFLEDFGIIGIDASPKLIGQSFSQVDDLVEAELKKLKQGDFSEESLEVLKRNIRKERDYYTEDNEEIGSLLGDYFTQGFNWEQVINYNKELAHITKKDIIEYANKIFGENYFALYSNKGKNNVEKLMKPPFKAIPKLKTESSDFYTVIQKKKPQKTTFNYIDFASAVEEQVLTDGTRLITTKNPRNNLFEITFKWDIGNYSNAKVELLTSYLNRVGTNKQAVNELKKAFQYLNSDYTFWSDERFFYFNVKGEESYLAQTLKLVNTFLNDIETNESVLKTIREEKKSDLKLKKATPKDILMALQEYAVYDSNSVFLKQLTHHEIKKIKAPAYVELFSEVQSRKLTINYIGNDKNVRASLEKNGIGTKDIELKPNDDGYVKRKIRPIKQNKVYFLPNKYTAQSLIYFTVDMGDVPLEEHYKLYAFNEYFGKGMGSLVFQELRERRALAYRVSGGCRNGIFGNNEEFHGVVGCQSDKTIEALNVYMGLINELPLKSERIETIKSGIIQSSMASRPGFRNISNQIERWKEQGYTQDPNYIFRNKIRQLTFEEMIAFYETYIKGKPINISIVGDKKRINFKELANFGEIIELKTTDIFVE
ncbi:MAG: insulinase family protein [Flavobacteriales bacterium]|jgi:predicted Zn-dependent peptidase|nr:insulinase family protein [Flavobacteriales bacterium]